MFEVPPKRTMELYLVKSFTGMSGTIEKWVDLYGSNFFGCWGKTRLGIGLERSFVERSTSYLNI